MTDIQILQRNTPALFARSDSRDELEARYRYAEQQQARIRSLYAERDAARRLARKQAKGLRA